MADPTAPQLAAVAFIYDRHTTPDREALRRRLEACARYAREQGWEIAGWYVDSGPQALSFADRPALDRLVAVMGRYEAEPRYLLTHNWARLSNDLAVQAAYARHVRGAGGTVCTVLGESDAHHRPGRPSNLVRL